MYRILFFETSEFTGATRVTRTIAKKVQTRFDVRTAVINDLQHPNAEIKDAIETRQPDIVFSSFSCINPEVILSGKENGLTVIIRQDYNLKDLNAYTKEKIYVTYPKADWIIAQTPEMKQEIMSYEALCDCRIKVIENPIDEKDILQKAMMPNPFKDNGCFHFLWVGRKDPIKDLPTLQKAFEIVHNQYPNTDLTIISNDQNPYRWMKHADCLVISSISEASPNVLREALFLGTNVISTNCSPIVRKYLPSNYIANVGCEEELAIVMKNALMQNKQLII